MNTCIVFVKIGSVGGRVQSGKRKAESGFWGDVVWEGWDSGEASGVFTASGERKSLALGVFCWE